MSGRALVVDEKDRERGVKDETVMVFVCACV